MTVVSMVTISSTNITGFFISVRGFSLRKAEPIAGTAIFGSNSADTGMVLRVVEVSMDALSGSIRDLIAHDLLRKPPHTFRDHALERRAGNHREMLDDGPERERREECEAADDQDHADGQADEQAAGGREGAGGRWYNLLVGERARNRHRGNDHPEAPDEHRDRAGCVV